MPGTTKKREPKSGGDFFGEGSYGCTFSPPPKCSSTEVAIAKLPTRKTDVLGKVFKEERDMRKELAFGEIMARIDPRQKIFLYPASSCETTLRELRKDPQATKCSYTTSSAMTNDAFHMVKMKRGGVTLDQYLHTHRTTPHDFVEMMKPVITGLKMLHKNGMVHHDLKFDNILYSPGKKVTNIIDFGLMQRQETVFDPSVNRYLYSNYWLHPPEYRIAQQVHSHPSKPTDDDGRALCQEVMTTIDVYFEDYAPATLRELIVNQAFRYTCAYEEAFLGYMKAVWRAKGSKLDFMRKQAHKIDIYSLGITMIYMSQLLHFRGSGARVKWMEAMKLFVHPDPRKRPSASRALSILQNAV